MRGHSYQEQAAPMPRIPDAALEGIKDAGRRRIARFANRDTRGRVENAHRLAEAVASQNRVGNLQAKRPASLRQQPRLDGDAAVLQQVASGADNVAQALRLDLELAEAGAELLCGVVGETACLARPRRNVPRFIVGEKF